MSHRAPSPERAAVRIGKAQGIVSRPETMPVRLPRSPCAVATSRYGQGTEVFLHGRLRRQRSIDGFPRNIVGLDVAHEPAPNSGSCVSTGGACAPVRGDWSKAASARAIRPRGRSDQGACRQESGKACFSSDCHHFFATFSLRQRGRFASKVRLRRLPEGRQLDACAFAASGSPLARQRWLRDSRTPCPRASVES